MKSKFVFSSAAIIAASHVGFAAAYIFSGGSDLSVPENYLLSDGASSFVSINSYYHDGNSGFVLPSGNLTKSETLPASYNWLGIGDYSGAEVESSPTDLPAVVVQSHRHGGMVRRIEAPNRLRVRFGQECGIVARFGGFP